MQQPDPDSYFKIAVSIFKSMNEIAPEDICYRTILNRLYYGIFYLVKQFELIHVPSSDTSRIHAYVKEKIAFYWIWSTKEFVLGELFFGGAKRGIAVGSSPTPTSLG